MHSPDSRFYPLVFLRHAALLLVLGCTLAALAACDRHSATEVPESYGHGSSHEKSYSDHQIDSRPHSASFSDTRGINAHEGPGTPVIAPAATPSPAPAASPAPTAAASKFFQ